MSLARNTKLSWANTQLPLMQLPWEQLDSIMASNQQMSNAASQMTKLSPRYIQQSQPDVQLAGEINAYQDALKKQMVELAKTGNTANYMSGMKGVIDNIQSLYKPGGAAYTLESRYAEFEKQKEAINKATEKNVNPLYKPFFENQLLEQLKEKDIFNPTTRVGKSIQPVNIFGEVQVGEEIDKYFKDWAKTKNVSIDKWIDKSGKVNPYYFEKYSVEGIGKEELQGALKFFYNQPHIKQAMGVEAWDIKRRVDPTMESQLVSEATMAEQTKFEASKNQVLSQLNVLEQKKNTKAVQDIVEQAGFKTWDEYKQSQLKDIEDTASAISQNPPSLDEIVSEQIKSKYTRAYVPKYAAIKEDRDLIVNQAAMESLRHRNRQAENSQMLSGMETLYRGQNAATFKTELDVQTSTIGSVFTEYTNSKNNFEATEKQLKTNPANIPMIGVLTSINNKSYTEQLLLVREAALESTKDGKIDPVKFASHINSNGGKVSSFAAGKMIEYLKNPNSRAQLESFSDMATPAYNVYTSSKQNLQEQVKQLDSNFKINWNKIAQSGGYKDKNGLPDANMARQAFEAGDTKVMNLLEKQVPKDTKVNSTVTMFKNQALGDLDKNLIAGLNASIHTLVKENFQDLSPEQLKSIGYDSKGKYTGEDVNPIVNANVGTRTINGKSEMVYVINGKYGDKPIILRPNQLSKDFNNEYLLNLSAQQLNPDNFGEVVNQTNFNDSAALFFDHNTNASGLNVSRVQAAFDRDDTKIASFTERVSNDNVDVRLVTDSETKQKYLIGVTGGANSTLQKYKKGTDYDINSFFKNNPNASASRHLIQSNDYNSILMGITELKADWAKPEIQYELMAHPEKVVKQKSNITTGFPDMYINSNETFNDN
jgi:hypothetical protein